jgi:hypothetical protein
VSSGSPLPFRTLLLPSTSVRTYNIAEKQQQESETSFYFFLLLYIYETVQHCTSRHSSRSRRHISIQILELSYSLFLRYICLQQGVSNALVDYLWRQKREEVQLRAPLLSVPLWKKRERDIPSTSESPFLCRFWLKQKKGEKYFPNFVLKMIAATSSEIARNGFVSNSKENPFSLSWNRATAVSSLLVW